MKKQPDGLASSRNKHNTSFTNGGELDESSIQSSIRGTARNQNIDFATRKDSIYLQQLEIQKQIWNYF